MTKKIIFAIAFLVICMAFVLFLRGNEDVWICEKGEWIKHGNPSAEMPEEICTEDGDIVDLDVRVELPLENEIIVSPVEIKGKARGSWYFEADFPIKIIDENGNTLGEHYATAKSDWMTEDFVEFESTVIFSEPETDSGFIVFQKDNPSGLIENAQEIRIPVKFSQEKIMVKAFFINNDLDPDVTCEQVFPVEREIRKTLSVGRAALEELLKGVGENEEGYETTINKNIKINSLTIEEGVAYIDFSEELQTDVAGSCLVSLIRKQIEETLKQFDTVDEVVISINGESEEILQP